MVLLMSDTPCTYEPTSNEPCATCPRLITCLYMCKLLQEINPDDDLRDATTFVINHILESLPPTPVTP
jgi:hypothetical protein